MTTKPKRKLGWIVGGLVVLVLFACVICIGLSYVLWNLPTEPASQASQPADAVPQSNVAISAANMDKVQKLYTFSPRANIKSIAWSPDSRLLAVGGDRNRDKEVNHQPEALKLWKVATGSELYALEQPEYDANYVTFSPDGEMFAATYENGIKIWNLADGSKIRTFNVWHENMGQIVFSPDGGTILVALKGRVESWDVVSARPLPRMDGYGGFWLAPGGKIIVAKFYQEPPSPAYRAKYFELETGQELWMANANPLALSHDGKVLAHGTGPIVAESVQATLTLTDLTNGNVLGKWDKFVYYSPVAFSPDDTLVAAQKSRDNIWAPFVVSLWNASSGKMNELDTGNAVRAIVFSPDGRFLAIGGDGFVQLWGIKP